MRVNLVYPRRTIQGEGPFSGRCCTFVRLYGCNLHCAWCDSAETWDTDGRNGIVYPTRGNTRDMTPHEVAKAIDQLEVDMVVITGGEPLIQRAPLTELAAILRGRHIDVHVETNGTLASGATLDRVVDHYVVSPKLPHAAAGNDEKVINEPVLRSFARLGWRHATFKTVVRDRADVDAALELYKLVGVERRAGWVMPEGVTATDVHDRLADVTEYALSKRLSVSGRMHVDLWGTDRGR
jgi:7-carboxy-7-deazaguanine synthase